MTDDIDSPGVEAGVGVEAGRGVGGAAGLRAVNLALISSNSIWLEDNKQTANIAARVGNLSISIY
jgi:hypothetical protein